MPELDALARSAAVVVAAADRDTLIVTGPDRLSWLEGLVTCELKSLAPGSGTWGLVLNRQGKIQSVVWVVAAADRLWLSFAPGTGAAMEAELGRMLIMEDAELSAPEQPHTWLSLHGPEAVARAAAWAAQAGGASAGIDFTGLGGAALVVPREREALVRAGSDGLWLDRAQWQTLRLERGLPEFGVDFDGGDRPHEAALDRRAVSWSKGCYLGQEVVCMQDMRGKVKRSVRVLRVDAPAAAPLAGGKIVSVANGKEAGEVTSTAFSARAGSWLVMAPLQLDAIEGGLRYEGEAGSHAARVSEAL
ncbi:MAG TPA: folate-binding protein YgfZ [Polyangiaceae bacterium]|nr:folate-binding protein YgfZ [Polyangiaceae bacterium]